MKWSRQILFITLVGAAFLLIYGQSGLVKREAQLSTGGGNGGVVVECDDLDECWAGILGDECGMDCCEIHESGAEQIKTQKCVSPLQCISGVCEQGGGTGGGTTGGGNDGPVCGDNSVDGDEECDDGNTVSGDGCSSDCKTEETSCYHCPGAGQNCVVVSPPGYMGPCTALDPSYHDSQAACEQANPQCAPGGSGGSGGGQGQCGDNTRDVDGVDDIFGNADDEECDEGPSGGATSANGRYAYCTTSCKLQYCGDGEITFTPPHMQENCEATSDCSTAGQLCHPRSCQCYTPPNPCGNGRLDPGEQCDEGRNNADTPNAPCRTNCNLPRCGDGIRDHLPRPTPSGGTYPGEQCDDGNLVPGDGCDQVCRNESHYQCQGNTCTEVPFPGQNGCHPNASCGIERHLVCKNQQCVYEQGPGQDECSGDIGCSVHTECVNQSCIEVPGAGTSECGNPINPSNTVDCSQQCNGLEVAVTEFTCASEDSANSVRMHYCGVPPGTYRIRYDAQCGNNTFSIGSVPVVIGDSLRRIRPENGFTWRDDCTWTINAYDANNQILDSVSFGLNCPAQQTRPFEHTVTNPTTQCNSTTSTPDPKLPDCSTSQCTASQCPTTSLTACSTPLTAERCEQGPSGIEVCFQAGQCIQQFNGCLSNGGTCDMYWSNCTCLPTQNSDCGNGVQEGTEECDDGNTVDDDACRNDCSTPRCGDGIQDAGEDCDEGAWNGHSGTCRSDCTVPRCGDGIVDVLEVCDDGNTSNTDSCTNLCRNAYCGDGYTQSSNQEDCDLGYRCEGGALDGQPLDIQSIQDVFNCVQGGGRHYLIANDIDTCDAQCKGPQNMCATRCGTTQCRTCLTSPQYGNGYSCYAKDSLSRATGYYQCAPSGDSINRFDECSCQPEQNSITCYLCEHGGNGCTEREFPGWTTCPQGFSDASECQAQCKKCYKCDGNAWQCALGGQYLGCPPQTAPSDPEYFENDATCNNQCATPTCFRCETSGQCTNTNIQVSPIMGCPGSNNFESQQACNAQCAPVTETHLECDQLTKRCIEMPGAGRDICTTDVYCQGIGDEDDDGTNDEDDGTNDEDDGTEDEDDGSNDEDDDGGTGGDSGGGPCLSDADCGTLPCSNDACQTTFAGCQKVCPVPACISNVCVIDHETHDCPASLCGESDDDDDNDDNDDEDDDGPDRCTSDDECGIVECPDSLCREFLEGCAKTCTKPDCFNGQCEYGDVQVVQCEPQLCRPQQCSSDAECLERSEIDCTDCTELDGDCVKACFVPTCITGQCIAIREVEKCPQSQCKKPKDPDCSPCNLAMCTQCGSIGEMCVSDGSVAECLEAPTGIWKGCPCDQQSYLACEDSQCKEFPGIGESSCTSNDDCADDTHLACVDTQCMIVPGAAKDDCSVNADCTDDVHYGCQEQQCALLPGAAQDDCSEDSECVGGVHLACEDGQCKEFPGAKENSCTSDIECGTQESSQSSTQSALSTQSTSSTIIAFSSAVSSLQQTSSRSAVLSSSTLSVDSSVGNSALSSSALSLVVFVSSDSSIIRVDTDDEDDTETDDDDGQEDDDGDGDNDDGVRNNTRDEDDSEQTVLKQEEETLVAAGSVCGNGVLEMLEECDDRNTRDDDGCSATCLLEIGICGDGIVQRLLGEQCESSSHDKTLSYGCKECLFASETCGDGKVDPGEECDLGMQNSNEPDADCRVDCHLPTCGDDVPDSAELCDDGNRLNGDGCDRYCRTEESTQVAAEQKEQLVAGQNTFPEIPTGTAWPNTLPPSTLSSSFTRSFPGLPSYQGVPYQLPLAQLQPLIQQRGPVGDTGPAAVAVIGAGAAAGLSWIRRKRK